MQSLCSVDDGITTDWNWLSPSDTPAFGERRAEVLETARMGDQHNPYTDVAEKVDFT